MTAFIDLSALPALRAAGIFFLIIDILADAYIFRNWHRWFDKDPDVHDDPKAVRNLRKEVLVIPWIYFTILVSVALALVFLMKRSVAGKGAHVAAE